MIDNSEKTTRLLVALKEAVPFKVELMERLVKLSPSVNMTPSQSRPSISSMTCRMRATKVASCAIWSTQKKKQALVVSLTQVRMPSIYAACGGGCRLSKTPCKEAKEAGSDLRRPIRGS